MDLLIKLAQGIALSEGCHSVAIEHVRAAVAMLELQEGHETTDVLEYLHMPRPFRSAPAEIVMRLAQSARTSQPLPLDADVRQMLQVFGDDYVSIERRRSYWRPHSEDPRSTHRTRRTEAVTHRVAPSRRRRLMLRQQPTGPRNSRTTA